MSPNKNLISVYYEEFDFPSADKLFKLIQSNEPDIKVTRREINDFIEEQKEIQMVKVKKRSKKSKGHITALIENELWVIDIFDLNRYSGQNSGYKYIFGVIDVFTRKAYTVKMKTKTIIDTTAALQEIIDSASVPSAILSDNDTSFLGKAFQELLNKYNIHHMTNTLEDHNALGIIDNFAKRIKTTLGKVFIKNDTTRWIDYLDKIVSSYNKTPHSSLYDIAPNDVMLSGEAYRIVQDINLEKIKANKITGTKQTDFKVGDRVRISIKTRFTKSNEAKFSSEVYEIVNIQGNNITLDNGKIYKPYSLVKTKDEPNKSEANPFRKTNVEKIEDEVKTTRRVRRDGIEPNFEVNQRVTRSMNKIK